MLVNTGILNPVHDFRFNPSDRAQTQSDSFGKCGVKTRTRGIVFREKCAVGKACHFLDLLHAHDPERSVFLGVLGHGELHWLLLTEWSIRMPGKKFVSPVAIKN